MGRPQRRRRLALAIAVDACGNVYASQNRSGFIYRISPAGVVTKVAELDAPDVPTLRFGQGSKADVLYAADPAHTRLLELHVGTPGATP